MGGTKAGGHIARDTNRKLYGSDFYNKIGAAGGRASHGGGFSDGEAGRERARIAGAKGGTLGRRVPRREVPKGTPCTYCKQRGHIAYDCIKRYDDMSRNSRIVAKYGVKRGNR